MEGLRHERIAAAVPNQALLGPDHDLSDRRAVVAGHIFRQEHFPVLRQSAGRAQAGLDHRPDRHRDDRGHPHRRHRPLGRLADGDLLGGLRHAAHRAGHHTGRDHGCAAGRAHSAADRRGGHPLRLPQPREIPPRPDQPRHPARSDPGCHRAGGCRRRSRRAGARLPAAADPNQVRRARCAAGRALRRPVFRGDQRCHHCRRPAATLHRDTCHDGDGARRRPSGRRPEQRGAPRLHRIQRRRGVRPAALPGLRRHPRSGPVLHRRDHCLRRGVAVHAVRPLRLCHWRQRGSGPPVRHRHRAHQDRHLRDLRPARRHRRRALCSAVSPGQTRCRRRPRTRRHRRRRDRRHQPDGRSRRPRRHVLRRADLRIAVQHPAAPQHRFEPPAGAEGPDHHRHRAGAGAQRHRTSHLSASAAAPADATQNGRRRADIGGNPPSKPRRKCP